MAIVPAIAARVAVIRVIDESFIVNTLGESGRKAMDVGLEFEDRLRML